MDQRGETQLGMWDSSVLEKPESEHLEGLGAVRSSRVRRLARSRKGVFNRPSGVPVSVRGFEWESLLLVGKEGRPPVVAMTWWGRAKGVEGHQRQQQARLLARAARQWAGKVRHVFDRGYGTGPWLARLSRFRVRDASALEERQQAAQRRRVRAQSLGDRDVSQRAWGTHAKLLWDTHFRV